ncbi:MULTISPECIES: zinc ribbon domain-containing protein [unclassified Streptomyces]|uniref:zinc ribbon domain-containing protein n=1 Tax=unclassified Streptomyces TaxID=2593676 RepID=UPI003D71BED7
MDGAWSCDNCGAEVPQSAQRCRNCGAYLSLYGDGEAGSGQPWYWRRRHDWTAELTQRPPPPPTPPPPAAPPKEERQEPPQPPPLPPVRTLQGRGTITGVARQVQMRTEVQGNSNGTSTVVVCTFRVEVRNRAGTPVWVVPVEIRGRSFEGSLSDGDLVRAEGKARRGTLRVKRLHNLTTGAEVRTGTSTAGIVLAILLVAAWVVFMILIW